MLETYLNGPPSLAGRLLAERDGTSDTVMAARTEAAKDGLAAWQATWDKLSREGEERRAAITRHEVK